MKNPETNPLLRCAGLAAALLAGCATGPTYHDRAMDFGAIRTVAVLPFANLSRDNLAGERVRDTFSNLLLASEAVYVLPQGEVGRGLNRAGLAVPTAPSKDEVVALGKTLAADAIFAGVVREYGEVRSGSSSANAISVSVQMYETQTGKVIWSASSTRGGVGFWDRVLGGGGQPMDKVTEDAVNELLRQLFQ
jgi:hypothetical protein